MGFRAYGLVCRCRPIPAGCLGHILLQLCAGFRGKTQVLTALLSDRAYKPNYARLYSFLRVLIPDPLLQLASMTVFGSSIGQRLLLLFGHSQA